MRMVHSRWFRLTLLLALPALVTFGTALMGRAARDRALEAIRHAGDPLLPQDFQDPPGETRPDATPWIGRVVSTPCLWDMEDLSTPEVFATLAERANRSEFGPGPRSAFERLLGFQSEFPLAAASDGRSWNKFWSELSARIERHDGLIEFSAAECVAIAVLALGLNPNYELATHAREFGSVRPTTISAVLVNAGLAQVQIPVQELLRVSDAVNVRALDRALDGDGPAVLQAIRDGLAVAHVHSTPCTILASLTWLIQTNRTLDALEASLPLLPPKLDVSDLEARLAALEPRSILGQGLRGERAIANQTYARFARGIVHGGTYLDGVPLLKMRSLVTGGFDQARLCSDYATLIESVGCRASQRKGVVFERPDSVFTPLANYLVPAGATLVSNADTLEARLTLARAALASYRGGAKAGLDSLAQSVDPFDGKPIRCGLGEDEVRFWSVGIDGVDDGGTNRDKDLIWRLRLR